MRFGQKNDGRGWTVCGNPGKQYPSRNCEFVLCPIRVRGARVGGMFVRGGEDEKANAWH